MANHDRATRAATRENWDSERIAEQVAFAEPLLVYLSPPDVRAHLSRRGRDGLIRGKAGPRPFKPCAVA